MVFIYACIAEASKLVNGRIAGLNLRLPKLVYFLRIFLCALGSWDDALLNSRPSDRINNIIDSWIVIVVRAAAWTEQCLWPCIQIFNLRKSRCSPAGPTSRVRSHSMYLYNLLEDQLVSEEMKEGWGLFYTSILNSPVRDRSPTTACIFPMQHRSLGAQALVVYGTRCRLALLVALASPVAWRFWSRAGKSPRRRSTARGKLHN